jgi:hypothetical protein
MATCAVPSTIIMFNDNLLLATCTSNLDTFLLIISDILVGHLIVNYSLICAASLSSVVTFFSRNIFLQKTVTAFFLGRRGGPKHSVVMVHVF